GLQMYAQDWDEILPPANTVPYFADPQTPANYLGSLIPYTRNKTIYYCPSSVDSSSVGYNKLDKSYACTESSCSSYQGNGVVMGRSLSVMPAPADIVYLDENQFRWSWAWLRPQLTDPKKGKYMWWHWNQGIGKTEQYS